MVEKSNRHKTKVLRTENVGKYISGNIENYLKKESIRHEYTVCKKQKKMELLKR